MRRSVAWMAGALALAVCVAGAYGAYLLAGYSWDQVVSYETPFGDYDRPWALDTVPAGVATPADAPRAVLVIVDGLRADTTQEMPGYQTLRQYGADMIAVTPQPSLSYPTWTTILSGASPDISGVTTNWFEGAVPVETLIDSALAAGLTVAVSAPDDFVTLYSAERAQATYFDAWAKEYLSDVYVDRAIELVTRADPALLVVHLPDVDEAGHAYGGGSPQYTEMAQRIDGEILRLVQALQDDRTLFVVAGDHGHIDAGGHGGWESVVRQVPALFIGQASSLEREPISQTDIAPTIAAYLGIPVPAHAEGSVLTELLVPGAVSPGVDDEHALRFAEIYLAALGAPEAVPAAGASAESVAVALDNARAERLAAERRDRLPMALGLGATAVIALLALFTLSWRAGVAATAGTFAYYLAYNGLYFVVHGYRWSLSAFNDEALVQQFFYLRMVEAAIAGLVAVAVAAIIYPLLRAEPMSPRVGGYLGGWLALGPATVLAVMATLALQVAWFLWAYGAEVVWRLPDLRWGFKYDLDLIQATAVGATALVAPLVTYLIGRYHPKTRVRPAGE
ncbi:MAG: alkaline phosphatase family protein [Anaerosomatales bacterium]|nr:alkaline phosphatase family protein [Anaerosomatales bacterium]MDT8434562.1 alkaline phosphatase family protein [Anaerosomatales bacterium]